MFILDKAFFTLSYRILVDTWIVTGMFFNNEMLITVFGSGYLFKK